MHKKTFSKVLVMFILSSMVSAATASSNAFTVLVEPANLEDILTEIDALNERLQAIESDITALNLDINSFNTASGNMQST